MARVTAKTYYTRNFRENYRVKFAEKAKKAVATKNVSSGIPHEVENTLVQAIDALAINLEVGNNLKSYNGLTMLEQVSILLNEAQSAITSLRTVESAMIVSRRLTGVKEVEDVEDNSNED